MTARRLAVPAIILAGILVAVALWPDEPDTRQTVDDLTATASCTAPERAKLQTGSHLVGDTPPPVPYSSSPPTSGWHASGGATVGVHDVDDPLTSPQHVSVLEGGGIIASYDPQRVEPQDITALEELAQGPLEGRLTVTPYTEPMPTPIALTAWGVLRRCEDVDGAAITAFVEALHGAIGQGH